MFALAILIGLYSFVILGLGMMSLLSFLPVFLSTTLFILIGFLKLRFPILAVSPVQKFFVLLIAAIAIVNLIGALGPEIAFDSLWYHLTIPKIYAFNETIHFIQGNLFYYSLMPRLTEMLYTSSLILGNEIVAKLVHYSFGIMTSIVLYKLAREFVSKNWAYIAVLIFYSNLVVSWLSIAAYVDLARAFFETLALLYFVKFTKDNLLKHLIYSALLVGFAVCTKIVSLIAIFIFTILLIRRSLSQAALFAAVSLIVPLPWFLISYFYTGNPFYPLFSTNSPSNLLLFNFEPIAIVKNIISVFIFSPDPINPIYAIAFPLLFILLRIKKYKFLISYTFLSIVMWYLVTFSGLWHATDQAGSARFLVPILPALSVLVVAAISSYKDNSIKAIFIGTVIMISATTIIYRGLANARYLPVILGLQTRQEFLMQNLNFDFGDFYDEDAKIAGLVGDKLVLIEGIHNLYYVDFNFSISEWATAKKAEYLLIRDISPKSYPGAVKIYENAKTNVKLYKL